jgi:hypothetical protein
MSSSPSTAKKKKKRINSVNTSFSSVKWQLFISFHSGLADGLNVQFMGHKNSRKRRAMKQCSEKV